MKRFSNLTQWFKRRCCLKIILSYSSVSPFVWQSGTICAILLEGNFGKGHYEEHFCEIILHLDQWFRRYGLMIFLIYSFGGNFVQWSGIVCAILGAGIMRNISVNLF